ncbi:DIP1984 family protein [Leucobacter sp. PH1c]|uniref:DIP1984 family protein n=1 Tax=Leucobacter sp. PH1c TaxID=1397278 RepID=UPI00046964BA|nr:DIP1984 family protein [Leucobacter sp. PH1c]
MKLAEALALRADTQKRIAQLRARIAANARFQEGEEPAEDAAALLSEAALAVGELEQLVRSINTTNSAVTLELPAAPARPSGGRRRETGASQSATITMTDALARRDSLRLRHSILVGAAEAAQPTGAHRQLRSELREVSALSVPELHTQADAVARELRELDAKIQQANWSEELTGE